MRKQSIVTTACITLVAFFGLSAQALATHGVHDPGCDQYDGNHTAAIYGFLADTPDSHVEHEVSSVTSSGYSCGSFLGPQGTTEGDDTLYNHADISLPRGVEIADSDSVPLRTYAGEVWGSFLARFPDGRPRLFGGENPDPYPIGVPGVVFTDHKKRCVLERIREIVGETPQGAIVSCLKIHNPFGWGWAWATRDQGGNYSLTIGPLHSPGITVGPGVTYGSLYLCGYYGPVVPDPVVDPLTRDDCGTDGQIQARNGDASFPNCENGNGVITIASTMYNGTVTPEATRCIEWMDAPDTTITDHPPSVTGDTLAEFQFTSDVPGSDFRCELDGEGEGDCNSGSESYDVEPGEHEFCVYAISPSGAEDPTPACYTWTVIVTTDECDGDPYENDFLVHDFTVETPDSQTAWIASRLSASALVCGTTLEASGQGTGTLTDHIDIMEPAGAWPTYTGPYSGVPVASYAGKLRARMETHTDSGDPTYEVAVANLTVEPLSIRSLGSNSPIEDNCNREAEEVQIEPDYTSGLIITCFIARSIPGSPIQWHSWIWGAISRERGCQGICPVRFYLTLGPIHSESSRPTGLTKVEELTICGYAGDVLGDDCGTNPLRRLHRNGDASFPNCENGNGTYKITATRRSGATTTDMPGSTYCVPWALDFRWIGAGQIKPRPPGGRCLTCAVRPDK